MLDLQIWFVLLEREIVPYPMWVIIWPVPTYVLRYRA